MYILSYLKPSKPTTQLLISSRGLNDWISTIAHIQISLCADPAPYFMSFLDPLLKLQPQTWS